MDLKTVTQSIRRLFRAIFHALSKSHQVLYDSHLYSYRIIQQSSPTREYLLIIQR